MVLLKSKKFKLGLVLGLSALCTVVISQFISLNARAVQINGEATNDSVADVVTFYTNDFHEETTIEYVEFNAGNGWISLSASAGYSLGQSTFQGEIEYADLPITTTDIAYRVTDGEDNWHTFVYVYPGDDTGCDGDCPVGNDSPFVPTVDSTPTVAQDTFASDFGASSLSTGFDNPIPANNAAIVSFVYYIDADAAVSNFNADGDAMSYGCTQNSGDYHIELWYNMDPPATAAPLNVVMTQTTDEIAMYAAVVENVQDTLNAFECTTDGGSASNTHWIGSWTDPDMLVIAGTTTGGAGSGNQAVAFQEDSTSLLNDSFGGDMVAGAASRFAEPDAEYTWVGFNGCCAFPSVGASLSFVPAGEVTTDTTAPTLTVDDEPGATTPGSSITFDITAADTETTISQAVISYHVVGDVSSETFDYIDADDGTYDSMSETGSYTIENLDAEEYEISIAIVNADGLSTMNTYTTTVVSDEEDPTLTMGNVGQDALSENTVDFSGSANGTGTNVTAIQYKIIELTGNTDEVGWTNVTITDGNLDEEAEAFTFTTPELNDGAKELWMQITDEANNTFQENVDRFVINVEDTTAPVISLRQFPVDPVVDPTPRVHGKVADNTDDLTSNIASIQYRIDAGSWEDVEPIDGTLNDEKEELFSIQLPELAEGDYTITVRAADAAGNDTNNSSANKSVEITHAAQPEVEATEVTSTTTFNDDTYAESEFTDLIWGGGRLRLAEEMTPEMTTLIDNADGNMGPRYGFFTRFFGMEESAAGGFWVGKINGMFSYYDTDTDTEYEFDLRDYLDDGTLDAYPNGGSPEPHDIAEVYSNGEYHLWIAYVDGITGINFGASITDGIGDTWASIEAGDSNLLEIDDRDTTNYGVIWNSDGNLHYTEKPASFPNDSYNPSAVTYTRADSAGYLVEDITAITFVPETNEILFGEYTAGVTVIDDNNTPGNFADDTITTYTDYEGVFNLGRDQNDYLYMIGDLGMDVVTDDNGTSSSADDTITKVATSGDLNLDVGAEAVYYPGDSVVPDQYFISNRTGELFYVSTNGTYTDDKDDQIIRLSLTDVYPAAIRDFLIVDDNTAIVALERVGVIEVDLNRLFVESGTAETRINDEIASFLDADYLSLDSVTRDDDTEAVVMYQVSNDGGTTWQDIEVGGEVDFTENGYEVVVRITMFRGSTPIISSMQISYAAYPDSTPEGRVLSGIEVTGTPTTVNSGDNFSFTVSGIDQLDNPYNGDFDVSLALRRVSDSANNGSFTPTSTTITGGSDTISNAQATATGIHQIVAQSGSLSDVSAGINFVGSDSSDDDDDDDEDDEDTDSDDDESDDDAAASSATPTPTIELHGEVIDYDPAVSCQNILIVWSVTGADSVQLNNRVVENSGTQHQCITADFVGEIVAVKDGVVTAKKVLIPYSGPVLEQETASEYPSVPVELTPREEREALKRAENREPFYAGFLSGLSGMNPTRIAERFAGFGTREALAVSVVALVVSSFGLGGMLAYFGKKSDFWKLLHLLHFGKHPTSRFVDAVTGAYIPFATLEMIGQKMKKEKADFGGWIFTKPPKTEDVRIRASAAGYLPMDIPIVDRDKHVHALARDTRRGKSVDWNKGNIISFEMLFILLIASVGAGVAFTALMAAWSWILLIVSVLCLIVALISLRILIYPRVLMKGFFRFMKFIPGM